VNKVYKFLFKAVEKVVAERYWKICRICTYERCRLPMYEAPCDASDCPHRTVFHDLNEESSSTSTEKER
jgi:hypothetical protein